jgi:hypothetical protein
MLSGPAHGNHAFQKTVNAERVDVFFFAYGTGEARVAIGSREDMRLRVFLL